MVLQATIDMLIGMKMTAMAAELSSQLQDSSFNELVFEDRLGLLVTAKWNRRQTNTVKRLIHNAHFAATFAAVEETFLLREQKARTRRRCYASSPANLRTRATISSSKALPATARPTLPAPCETLPATVSRRSTMSYVGVPRRAEYCPQRRRAEEMSGLLQEGVPADLGRVAHPASLAPESYGLLEIVEAKANAL